MSLSSYKTFHVPLHEYGASSINADVIDSKGFYSIGRNGVYELRILITKQRDSDDYRFLNLGFGVWNKKNHTLTDTFETRNGDMEKILGTVANYALAFLLQNSDCALYAEGSTKSRTRLYQREISKVIGNKPDQLKVFGIVYEDSSGFINFKPGINFDGFLFMLA